MDAQCYACSRKGAALPWRISWDGSTALVGGNATLPWRIYWGGSTALVGGNAALPWHISWGGSTALVGGNATLPWRIYWGGSTVLVGGNATLPWHISWGGSTALVGGNAALPWHISWGGSTALVGGNATLPWRIYWGGSTALVGGNAALPWHISWGGSTALVGGNATLPWRISWGGSTALVGGNATLPWRISWGGSTALVGGNAALPWRICGSPMASGGYRRRGLWGIPCFSERERLCLEPRRLLPQSGLVGGKEGAALPWCISWGGSPLASGGYRRRGLWGIPCFSEGERLCLEPRRLLPQSGLVGGKEGAALPWCISWGGSPLASGGYRRRGLWGIPCFSEGERLCLEPRRLLPQSGLVGGKEGAAPLGCMSRQHAAQHIYPLLVQGGEGLIQNPEGRGD